MKTLDAVDFAILVLTPDDVIHSRDREAVSARGNVLSVETDPRGDCLQCMRLSQPHRFCLGDCAHARLASGSTLLVQ